jgi:hypothetical protein
MFRGSKSRKKNKSISKELSQSKSRASFRSLLNNRKNNIDFENKHIPTTSNLLLDESLLLDQPQIEKKDFVFDIENLLLSKDFDEKQFDNLDENDIEFDFKGNEKGLDLSCYPDKTTNELICEGFLTKSEIDNINDYIPKKEITYIKTKPLQSNKIKKLIYDQNCIQDEIPFEKTILNKNLLNEINKLETTIEDKSKLMKDNIKFQPIKQDIPKNVNESTFYDRLMENFSKMFRGE